VTLLDFARWKIEQEPITILTAYDWTMARILDEVGVDCLLVGDSMGTVVQGRATTLPVTLDQVVYHAEMVSRAAQRAFVVADLPFLSYQASTEQAILSAGRLMKEAGCRGVKLEGGRVMVPTVRALVDVGIPVMAHIGLTPQAVHRLGGYKVQRDEEALLADARAVADAGAFAVVLECIPSLIAEKITSELAIPTIGIGAGSACDGQVLVAHDMLGLFEGFQPKFVRRYAELGEAIRKSARAYLSDVKNRQFPDESESFV
jgi:3-methyl-2-oxobutanoate hydroxymethyltransferase